MNGVLQGQIWDAELNEQHRDLLVLMSWYADKDGGNIYPALATLARRLNRTDRHVRRLLRELQDAGYVELISGAAGPGRTYHYRIVADALKPREHDDSGLADTKERTFPNTGHFGTSHRTFRNPTPDIFGPTPDIQMSAKIKKEQEVEIENTTLSCWKGALSILRARINPHRYDNWIRPLRPYSKNDDLLVLAAPNSMFAAKGQEFTSEILEALAATGAEIKQLRFVVRRSDDEW